MHIEFDENRYTYSSQGATIDLRYPKQTNANLDKLEQRFIEACTFSKKGKDWMGYELQTIHMDLFYRTPDDTLKTMLNRTSKRGNSLIDLALKFKFQSILWRIAKYFPSYANVKDQNGNTFLHKAILNNCGGLGFDVLSLPAGIGKELARIKNNNGDTYLHLAMKNPDFEAIGKEALKRYPELAKIKNNQNLTFIDMSPNPKFKKKAEKILAKYENTKN